MDARVRHGAGQARRDHLIRALTLGLGALCVGAVLLERGAHPAAWTLLVLHGLVWPHIACLVALRSADPQSVERRHLLADAALGGLWIALMGFSLLPSVLLAAVLLANTVDAGGGRLLVRGALVMAGGTLATALLTGLQVAPWVSNSVLLACLPLLAIYPLVRAAMSYRTVRRLRHDRHTFEQLSRTDALSGLHNRLYWDERVAVEFARLQRHGGDATLLLLDIDRFKAYNDTWGHGAGDEAIRQVARILRQEGRIEDAVVRYGGEEFALLLPGIGLDQALAAADRLREQVERGCGEVCGLTVSVGAAPFASELVDPDEWVQRADRALYVAKRAGRNRSELAAPATGEATPVASVGT